MQKLCLIFNMAPLYNEDIYCALESVYDCDWHFGPADPTIKEMNVSLLKSVFRYRVIGNPNKCFLKLGMLPLLFKRKYQNFFMLAETHSVTDWAFFWLASVIFPKKRIYIWTHGWYGCENAMKKKMKLWLFQHVTGVFIYGNYARQLAIKEGISPKKVFTIHNSLHYDQQKALRDSLRSSNIYSRHFGNEKPVLIFIGRLTKVKRLKMLVDVVAMDKVCYNLVLVGEGSEKASLEQLARDLGVASSVWFYGACYDEKVNSELIFNADLCVSPGNVGLTAIHALTFGTPVVSHNDFTLQMPEFEAIIPNRTGNFFERDSEESLARVIDDWFEAHGSQRETVRLACYQEIDTQWNPYFQMNVIRKNLRLV